MGARSQNHLNISPTSSFIPSLAKDVLRTWPGTATSYDQCMFVLLMQKRDTDSEVKVRTENPVPSESEAKESTKRPKQRWKNMYEETYGVSGAWRHEPLTVSCHQRGACVKA